jgi:hypothetical protein
VVNRKDADNNNVFQADFWGDIGVFDRNAPLLPAESCLIRQTAPADGDVPP